MKKLIIVGARGWGREVYASAIRTKAYRNKEYIVKGFLDSNTDALNGLKGDYPPILCAPEKYEIQPDDVFFIAMGDPHWRMHYAELIEAKGGKFISIISDNASINPTATIGDGSFISGWSVVSDNVRLGKHSIVHVFCDLGHDVTVGDFSTIESYVFVGGAAEIGNLSVMHVRSTLIRHKKIGNNVSVGANSVVIKNVKDGISVFGNPAKKITF